jgi:hypothetical protein
MLDCPRPGLTIVVRRQLRSLLGTLVTLAGLAIIPALAVLVATAKPSAQDHPAHTSDSVAALFLVGVAGLVLVFLVVGRWLRRGARNLVLFLRRFGYTDASGVVTHAVLGSLGRSWRVVTLEDASISPVDIPGGTKRLFRAAEGGVHALTWPFQMIATAAIFAFWIAVCGMSAIAASRAVRDQDLGTLGRAIWPSHPISGDAQAFHVLFIVAVVSVGATAVGLGVVAFVTALDPFVHVTQRIRAAEQSSRASVSAPSDLRPVISLIKRRSRRFFGPRLVVVAVSSDMWQKVVQRLASTVRAILIDVSEPTDNLLWEIQNIFSAGGTRCVLIGRYDRVRHLALDVPDPASTAENARRLAALLDGHEVLAYTTDPGDFRRFTRSLRSTLETVTTG